MRSLLGVLCGLFLAALAVPASAAPDAPPPTPLLGISQPVTWWLAFKFNTATSPAKLDDPRRICPFGGTPQTADNRGYKAGFSQDYAFASSADARLTQGAGMLGTGNDPLGATFKEVYNGNYSYVVWNDDFHDAPKIPGCCGAPFAHSKGMLAWDDAGNGITIQVTTPSWPGAGSAASPRLNDGNTLGCVVDNNVLVSQHFFALKLTPVDTALVLEAIHNAGVGTQPSMVQVARLRDQSPANLRAVAQSLGDKTPADAKLKILTLSSGVRLISKPSVLNVPPWQAVSAILGGEPLRVATWWTQKGALPSTKPGMPGCWAPSLPAAGRVEIAMKGAWAGRAIGLTGGAKRDGNHAKIGVSLANGHGLTILGDMNQTGRLKVECAREQNGRGGLFYVLDDQQLWASVTKLLSGTTAADGDATVAEGAPKWTASGRPNNTPIRNGKASRAGRRRNR